MKKLIVIVLLCIMCLPISVFGATSIFSHLHEPVIYNAYVSNKNGVTAYCFDDYEGICTDIFLPYLTKFKTSDEVFIDEELYVIFTYEEREYSIRLDDIKIANGNKETFNVGNFNTLTYKDIYLYSGPSYAYDKVIKVPKDTKLKVTYSNDLWGYTEYNGKIGWINYFAYGSKEDYNDCLAPINMEYYLYGDLNLVSSPLSSDNVVAIVPKGNKIKFELYYDGTNGISFYTEYNGVKGWVNNINDYDARGAEIYDSDGLEVMVQMGGSLLSLKELNIYSDVHKSSVIGTIPIYTDVKMNYPVLNKQGDKAYLNIEYNGINGWVIDEDAEETVEDDCYVNYPYAHFYSTYDSFRLLKDIKLKNVETNNFEIIKMNEIFFTDIELADPSHIYYNGNKYEYIDLEDGSFISTYYDEQNNNDEMEDEIMSKVFEFNVNVPDEVLNAGFLGVDYFLEDLNATNADDAIPTISDDVVVPKQDDDKLVDIFKKIPMIYYIIGGSVFVLIIALIVVAIIKRKNKNVEKAEEIVMVNNDVIFGSVDNNNSPSETVSQEQNDNNETQL